MSARDTDEVAIANRALESFSYSVSHDLKAPLRAVSSLVQIMREDHAPQLDDEGRKILMLIQSSCERMDGLIAALLEFSQVTSQPLDRADVDISTLARSAWADIVTAHTGPAPTLDIGSLPGAVGDPSLLRQVWRNVLGNAVKYSTRSPAPEIRVSGYREGRTSVFRVCDNGVGFDMKHSDRLFGVFQRLHRSEEFVGTGIGLAIVRQIISRHGGRVWAEGQPGIGASFNFTLPDVDAEIRG